MDRSSLAGKTSRHALKLPGAGSLKVEASRYGASLPTGIAELDRLLEGGIPRGAISVLAGAGSGGRTGVLYSILARATWEGETAAYVDAFETFDPRCASESGILLESLLWVRCGGSTQRALRAADVLVRAGGFGVVALDLETSGRATSSPVRPPEGRTWFRLQRGLAGSSTVLVVLPGRGGVGGAAAVVLWVERTRTFWISSSPLENPAQRRARLFDGMEVRVEPRRGRHHGHVTFHSYPRR